MTTGKIIALTRPNFVGKVMSLLFNILSRLVIAFLPRSKRLLISWLLSPFAVILEPKKIKSVTEQLNNFLLDTSVQFSSVAQSCPTLCDPMDYSTPGLPVHHQLPEFTQTPVHWVGDAIQPCHPLLPPSPPAFNLPQDQGLFQWVVSASSGQSIGASASASILPMNIQDWFPLELAGLISLQSKGLSRVFSNTTVQKHQFFGAQRSLWSKFHIHIWLLEKL